MPHHPGEIAGTEAPIKTAHLRAGLTEHRVVRRQAEITQQMQHLAAPHGVTGHQGDHHLGQAADDPLQIEHVEARQAVVADVTAIAAHALITAGTEGKTTVGGRANAGEQHHTDLAVIADAAEGIAEFGHRLGAEGIALGRAVDRHAGDARRAAIQKDVLVAAPGQPVHRWRTGKHLPLRLHQPLPRSTAF